MDANEILDAFELLPEWDARYELISDLGRELPPMPAEEKTDANLVRGCNTPAWLIAHLDRATGVLEYRGDAEGPLVRGLVALLLVPFRGKSPAEILATDPSGFFGRLAIAEHLSPTRRVGMQVFLERVQALARVAQRGSTSSPD